MNFIYFLDLSSLCLERIFIIEVNKIINTILINLDLSQKRSFILEKVV